MADMVGKIPAPLAEPTPVTARTGERNPRDRKNLAHKRHTPTRGAQRPSAEIAEVNTGERGTVLDIRV
ncbi:MAG: hypothetical protein NZ578_00630 [Candidatus Binatia bacterium]|nr:hypothetical protein [Candidatus Binatia bacterium]